MSELNRYYLQGIAPALLGFIIITIAVHLIDGSFYMLGFAWPYSYYTPGLSKKLEDRYGRFSFLNMSYSAHEYLFSKMPNQQWRPLVHLVAPVLFVGLLSLISFSTSFLWTFLGWLHFEVFFFMKKRKLELLK